MYHHEVIKLSTMIIELKELVLDLLVKYQCDYTSETIPSPPLKSFPPEYFRREAAEAIRSGGK